VVSVLFPLEKLVMNFINSAINISMEKKESSTISLGDSNNSVPQSQFQTYSALLNRKRRKDEDDTSTPRRKIVQSRDGRVWYAPQSSSFSENMDNLTNSQNEDNNNNNNNAPEEDNSTIYLGADSTIPINPYGSFREKSTEKVEKEKKSSPRKDSDDKKESKIRKQYRSQVAKFIVSRLSRYYKNNQITNRDDFKHLSRKFTHKFITWEDNHNGNYKMDHKKTSTTIKVTSRKSPITYCIKDMPTISILLRQ